MTLKTFPPSVPSDDPSPTRSAWVTMDGWRISTADDVFYGTAMEVIQYCEMPDGRMFYGHDGAVTSVAGQYHGGTYMVLRPATS